jgi:hypothetical protein
MTLPQTSIERAFLELLDRACRHERLSLEFQSSRREFQGADAAPPRTRAQDMAARRHAEWFLLERSGEAVEGLPAESLGADLASSEEFEMALAYECLLGSFASVFEITGVNSGEGVWVRDLAGQGEYPLEEADASRALAPADLLVGRIFPVGDALYRISHASGFFRDERLLRAVRQDLEGAREGRRGVLRLSQRELETMFFSALNNAKSAGIEAKLDASADAAALVVEAARRTLAEGGMRAAEIEDVLAELAVEPFDPNTILPGAGDRLGEILAELAFRSDVDLEAARRALALAWPVLSAPPAAPRERAPEPEPKPRARRKRSKQERAEHSPNIQRALAEFDAGRAKGADLEQLFSHLERQLELESDDAPDESTAPDFPGVVGAMVIEFLWDIERERGAQAARELAAIANFAQFAASHGVFENLAERDLLLFCCLWLPERATSGSDAARSFQALLEFAAWAQEQHEVNLKTALEPLREALAASLPRVCNANARLRKRLGPLPEGGEMLGFEGGSIARSPQGDEREVSMEADAVPYVEPGDFLRARPAVGGKLQVVCVYPPQTARLGELG